MKEFFPGHEPYDLWEIFHPADSDENEFPENGEWPDLEDVPQTPTIDHLPPVVDYSTRAPGDFVISGPLGDARGAGRKFESIGAAAKWARGKYGAARVMGVIEQGDTAVRWALLIKGAQ